MPKQILLRPYITEKTTRMMEGGHYAFVVDKGANKIQIRNAIEERYPGVLVRDVRTMVVRGKRRNQFTRRGRVQGRTATTKRAIITLDPAGEQIDFFENV